MGESCPREVACFHIAIGEVRISEISVPKAGEDKTSSENRTAKVRIAEIVEAIIEIEISKIPVPCCVAVKDFLGFGIAAHTITEVRNFSAVKSSWLRTSSS